MIYKGDYLRHNVSALSIAAQGLWLRLMILMHDSERPGYLCLNSESMPPRLAATKCSVSLDEYSTLLAELDSVGAFSRSTEGILYSPQIVEEAATRAQNAKRQRDFKAKQGNAGGNGKVTPKVTEKERKGNAVSSSSSSVIKNNGQSPLNLWDIATSILTASGMSDPRKYLGKLTKEYGKQPLAAAITAMAAEQPVDPKSYLVKILQNSKPQARGMVL